MHLQFEFNGIKSEIQLHTKQGWEIKKKQDEIYKVLREEDINQTMNEAEFISLKQKSRKLGDSHEFSINDFASFEVKSMVSSNSETSVLRIKSDRLENLTQEPPLNSKQPPLVETSPTLTAYNRLDSTLNEKSTLPAGRENKSLESTQTPLISNSVIPQKETKHNTIKDSITMQSNARLGSGFLGGVMSGKSIERLAKNPKAKAVMERIYLKKRYNSKNTTRQ